MSWVTSWKNLFVSSSWNIWISLWLLYQAHQKVGIQKSVLRKEKHHVSRQANQANNWIHPHKKSDNDWHFNARILFVNSNRGSRTDTNVFNCINFCIPSKILKFYQLVMLKSQVITMQTQLTSLQEVDSTLHCLASTALHHSLWNLFLWADSLSTRVCLPRCKNEE